MLRQRAPPFAIMRRCLQSQGLDTSQEGDGRAISTRVAWELWCQPVDLRAPTLHRRVWASARWAHVLFACTYSIGRDKGRILQYRHAEWKTKQAVEAGMGGSAADACRVTSRPAITTENQRWHQLFRNQRKLAVSARGKPAPRLAPTQAHTTGYHK